MALGALQRGVETGEWESRGRMIERRAGPVRGRVTQRAVLRETGRRVRRIVCAVVVGLVAADACTAGEAEVVIDVTLVALQCRVESSEREARGRMIKRRSRPVGG